MSVSVPDYTPSEILRYGAYVSFVVPEAARSRIASAAVPALVERLGFHNEFYRGAPGGSYAFLRGALTDSPSAMIHVASETTAAVDHFCREISVLLEPAANVCIHRGVIRPTSFTGSAMHEF